MSVHRRRSLLRVAVALLLAAGGASTTPAQAARADDRWLVSEGVWLRYRVLGATGPVLLLLHGSSDQTDPLLPLARSLAVGRRVVLVDQRGFGMSGKPLDSAQYGPAFVDDAVQLLDALRATRADVLGYGIGAVIAAKLTAAHPERVRRTVLVGGPVYHDRARLARVLAPTVSWLERGSVAGVPAGQGVLTAEAVVQRAFDRRAMRAALVSLPALAVDPTELRRARVPVLAVAGTRDAFVDAARELPSWWPGATTALVDGGTHEGVLDDPRLAARVRAFLAAP